MSREPTTRPLKIFTILLAIVLFNWFGWPFKIRFMYAPLNYWFTLLICIALIFSFILAANTSKSRLIKTVQTIFASVMTLPIFLFGMLAATDAIHIHKLGYDASLQLLKEVPIGISTYRLYRINCGGATCGPSLKLHREIEIPIGIKLIQELWSKYRESDADMRLVSKTEIHILQNGKLVTPVKI